ncbi:hypothetical protein [Cellulomonas sp.]|uniref:hypothetical protein n=1 Tax=Cellulomonas sp. TaxID=40001 RepID=UPI003BAD821A
MRALEGNVATAPIAFRLRADAVVVSGVSAAAGIALLAVAWSIGSVGWMLADVPGAENSVLREALLALFGAGFLAVAVVGMVSWRRGSRGRSSIVAVGLSAAALLLAVVGAGRFAAHSAASVLRPVLVDADMLNISGSNGVVMLIVALGMASAALVVLSVGRTRP